MAMLQVAVLLLIIVPPLPLKGLIDLAGILAITAGLVFIMYGVFSLGRVSGACRVTMYIAQPWRMHQ